MKRKLMSFAERYAPRPLAQTSRTSAPEKSRERDEPDIPATRYRTEIYTYFTRPQATESLLYSAESWVHCRFFLESAGPVALSTRENVSPVFSGKGITLIPNVEVDFILPKGNRIFITAPTVQRVRFIVEPVPWLEQISIQIGRLINTIKG